MKNRKQKITSYILTTLLVLSLLVSGCKKATPEIDNPKTPAEPNQIQTPDVKTPAETNIVASEPVVPKAINPIIKTKPVEEQKPAPAKQYLPEIQKLIDLSRSANWVIKAKNWTGIDVGDTILKDIDGKNHKIADYKGKELIVLSIATWAPACKSQIEFLKDVTQKYSNEQLAVILLVADKDFPNQPKHVSVEKLKDFFNNLGVDYPIISQKPEDQPALFQSNNMVPCHYFISSDSTVKLVVRTTLTPKYLSKIIDVK